MRLLELGKIITIEKEEGLWYYPALLEISLNLDNSEEFSMTFANAMRLDDWGYTYADLISDASSTSRKVSANWQDILAYSKERAEISSLIKDPLDTTLRASFANMVNQEFTVDKNGILGRKKVSETSDEFEDEQVRLINNLLIFTDDNWETAKTALGKIYYTDDDGNQVTSYGIIAETIIGSLIMGERLKIKNTNSTVELGAEGITIKKADGTVVFQAGADGTLLVRNYATTDSVASAIELANNGIKMYVTSTAMNDTLKGYATTDSVASAIELANNGIKMYVTSTAMNDTLKGYATTDSVASAIELANNGIKMYVTSTAMNDTLKGYATTDSVASAIELANNGINAYVTADGGSKSSFGWSLKSTGFYIYANASTVMKVTSSGLEISGAITAGSTITGAAINGGTIDIGDVLIVNEEGRVSIKSSAGNGNGILRIDNYWVALESGSTEFNVTSTRLQFSSDSYVGSLGRNVHSSVTVSGSASIQMVRDGTYFTIYIDGSARATCPHNLYITGTWTGSSAGSISSDVNKKNTITNMADAYEVLFDELRACTFKYNDGTSDRVHTGYIAQEVKAAMDIAGISTQDFAALCIDRPGTEYEEWSLRYEEFVSLNTWQIQKLKRRVSELEALVAQLTNKE